MEKIRIFKFHVHVDYEEILIFEEDSNREKMKIPFSELNFDTPEDIKWELIKLIKKHFANAVTLIPFDDKDNEKLNMIAMKNCVESAG